MIAFIRKSLENGSLVVEDRISFQRINRGEPIIREHKKIELLVPQLTALRSF